MNGVSVAGVAVDFFVAGLSSFAGDEGARLRDDSPESLKRFCETFAYVGEGDAGVGGVEVVEVSVSAGEVSASMNSLDSSEEVGGWGALG